MKKSPELKIAIAQMNPTVGDYSGNTAKILAWIDEAERKGADLIVFPECALCGYPVWDLANKRAFVNKGLQELRRIAKATCGKRIAAVLGFIDTSSEQKVRGSECRTNLHSPNSELLTPYSYNAAAWLEAGKVRAVYHKRLLPTYDVFLEEIFFRAGEKPCVVPFRGRRIGLSICEDLWDADYDAKPLACLRKKDADLVINISASPYYQGVQARREALVRDHSCKYRFPIIYVNQIGGQDDLLFDGASFVMDEKGRKVFQAPEFEEGLFFPQDSAPSQSKSRFYLAERETYQALVMGVRDYFRKNKFHKALIGLSGGIDSALVACIAVDALGKEAVKGVTLPGPYSSEGSWEDSEALAKNLGIEFEVRPIREMYKIFIKTANRRRQTASSRPTLAMENLQARLRGLELMYLSNSEGRLLLTTGNKSELAMGYCTLYGDMAGGLAVIGDVYKTDVYALSRYRNSVPIPINRSEAEIGAVPTTIRKKNQKIGTVQKVIPQPILTKAPSAELAPGQKDQDSLPPYEVLDAVLRFYIEKNLGRDEIIRRLKKKVLPTVVADVVRKVDHNEYKRRQTPPILRVTEKAWFGRRMPITNRFQG